MTNSENAVLDNERLVWMFTQMLRIREFEERVKRTFEDHPGVIRGHTHLADGAEASIVGSLATLEPGDQLLTTYRCHGYPIVLFTQLPNGWLLQPIHTAPSHRATCASMNALWIYTPGHPGGAVYPHH